jgi:transposase
MPKSRPPYPPEFREQMVELVHTGRGPEELAEEFRCSAQSIRNWVAQSTIDKRKPTATKQGVTIAEREELARLRRQVRQLQMERDILAKATAWFAGKNGPSSSS